jgi:hypothetical protein
MRSARHIVERAIALRSSHSWCIVIQGDFAGDGRRAPGIRLHFDGLFFSGGLFGERRCSAAEDHREKNLAMAFHDAPPTVGVIR